MRKSKIYRHWLSSSTAASYSTEAQAVFTKMPTTLSTAQKTAVNRFIVKAKSRGHYTGCLDHFILCGGLGAANNGLVDWIGTRNATTVASPTWANATGYTTNGTSSYLNATFNPSTDFTNATANDHFYFCVIKNRTTADGASAMLYGAVGTNVNWQASLTQTATGIGWKEATSGTTTNAYFTNIRKNTMHMTSRENTTTSRYFTNGQQLQAISSLTAVAQPNKPFFLGARNNNGTADLFMGAEILCWGVGKFTALNTPQLFWVDLETMLMELGCLTQSGTYGVGEGTSSANDALVVLMAGQSLEAGSNSSTPYTDLQGALDARIAYRNTFAGAFSVNQLQFGVNQNWENPANWGIELRLAKEIAVSHPSQRLVIVKFGYSGSAMYQSATTYDWNASTSPQEGFFDFRTRFIAPTITQLQGEGKNIRIVALDWYQGQTDALGDDVGADPNYKANFTAALKKFIDDMMTAGYDLSRMWVIVHRILDRYSPSRPFTVQVRADLDAMANFLTDNPTYVGKIAGVVVNDCDDLINDSDTIHESYFAPDVRAARVARFIKSKL
jgi:hypothetical protein